MIRLSPARFVRLPGWLVAVVGRGLLRRGLASSLAVVLLVAVSAAGLPYAWCVSMQRSSCCCHAKPHQDGPAADRARPQGDQIERTCCETRDTDALPAATTASTVLQPQLAAALATVMLPGPEPVLAPTSMASHELVRARAPPLRPRRAIERCIELQRFHC